MNGFYQSKAWRRLSARVRRAWVSAGYPCAWCGEPVSSQDSLIADHVETLRKRPDLALDPANLVVMHHRCHSRKTQSVDYGKPAIGPDGFPVGSDWS